jgi:hypothetical protein
LHILDLTTGKDVELALVKGFGASRRHGQSVRAALSTSSTVVR